MKEIRIPHIRQAKIALLQNGDRPASVAAPRSSGRMFKRYPDEVEGFFFYEKQCPSHHPKWVKTVQVTKSEGAIDYCIIDNLPALVWIANMYSLRPKEHPTVSTPIPWDEVETSVKRKSEDCLNYEAAVLIKRREKRGDLFSPVLSLKQHLPNWLVRLRCYWTPSPSTSPTRAQRHCRRKAPRLISSAMRSVISRPSPSNKAARHF